MNKKAKFLLGVLAGIVAALAVSGMFFYVDSKIKVEPRRFVKEKDIEANKIYDRLVAAAADYPRSPEGVMDFYNDAFYMMYSNMIMDDGTLFEVMEMQRKTYSDELRELNPENIQFANLKNALKDLYSDNNICLSVERKETVYDERTPGECVVQVVIYYNTFGNLYRNYYLIKGIDGLWRVNGWELTDEKFM